MPNTKTLLPKPADGQAWRRATPLGERQLTAEEAETAARIFKALSDPVRLRLLSAVASHKGGEASVRDVIDLSDVSVTQATVSHHLKKLREAGLLASERRGSWVYYRIEVSVLAEMGQMLTRSAPVRDEEGGLTLPANPDTAPYMAETTHAGLFGVTDPLLAFPTGQICALPDSEFIALMSACKTILTILRRRPVLSECVDQRC